VNSFPFPSLGLVVIDDYLVKSSILNSILSLLLLPRLSWKSKSPHVQSIVQYHGKFSISLPYRLRLIDMVSNLFSGFLIIIFVSLPSEIPASHLRFDCPVNSDITTSTSLQVGIYDYW
jgi:hypothetical protein